MQPPRDLQLAALRTTYSSTDVKTLLLEVHSYALACSSRNLWIDLVPERYVLAQLQRAVERQDAGETLALFGVPFAVKDNIDVESRPTTAACPAFAYTPNQSATCVERLTAAGAIVIGKTNLDQFATGLVGTRSPYGACASAFDSRYISGGSSSGSALAVALGCVSFALGTDTAGSGRVPAGFNNVVGLKPTRGLISTRGVVPACRSLDCVSVFAGSVADAQAVLGVASGFDAHDPYSRSLPNQERGPATAAPERKNRFRFGVPQANELRFDGDTESARAFERACAQLEALGGRPTAVDFRPFREAAELLYCGPWVAERTAAVGGFITEHPNSADNTVAQIIRGGARWSAVDCFEAQYKLAALRHRATAVLETIDMLVVPTTPTAYTLSQIAADPVELNSRLGWYTNFTNLLDLCAIAVPAGFKDSGLPFGVTLLAPAQRDTEIAAVAARYHDTLGAKVGATPFDVRSAPLEEPDKATTRPQQVELAVVGAHLQGQALHHQLKNLDATRVRVTRTSANYKLYALSGTTPPKPGLVRVPQAGTSIEVETYSLTPSAFGQFTCAVPSPLGIGNVELEDGSWVKGFICEPYAVSSATDISAFGGWRAFVAQSQPT